MSDDRFRDRDKELRQEDAAKKMRPGQIVGLVALILLVVFALQNLQEGTMNFLWLDLTLPVWVFFAAVFLLGAIFGWFFKARRAKKV